VFLRFPWQQQAFWNFQASKPFIHMPYNISIKFHPIPSTLNFSCFCQPQKTWKICIWRSFCTLVTMATAAILKKKLTPPKAATHYGGYSYKVSWSLTKGIQFFLNPLFFCFHGYCGKVCPTDSDLFNLSCSTRCGWCSYQVSSISVQRVTCYDHFCVFQFFSILAVSMATAAILKIPEVVCTSTHSA
jgi:hypothetical protein